MSAVRVFDTPHDVAAAVAEAFVSYTGQAVRARGYANVALAGGTTPKAAYTLLARPPLRERVRWEAVHAFFGDERCVGPEDTQSNYRMARESFLDDVNIPAENVHRIRGEDDPAQAALDYADILIALLGEAPRFDLVMLGMGPDGHTASLFPGTDPRTDQELLVRAVWVETMQTHRITLTPAAINAARHVVIATEGIGKAAMLQTVLGGPSDIVAHPVQCVKPADGSLEWFVDRAAHSLLDAAPRTQ